MGCKLRQRAEPKVNKGKVSQGVSLCFCHDYFIWNVKGLGKLEEISFEETGKETKNRYPTSSRNQSVEKHGYHPKVCISILSRMRKFLRLRMC